MAKPKIRFKGYTDDWEQRKLGETCKLNGRIGFRGYTERDIVTKEAYMQPPGSPSAPHPHCLKQWPLC